MEAVERENTQELIGILQAISIVAKSLAVKRKSKGSNLLD